MLFAVSLYRLVFVTHLKLPEVVVVLCINLINTESMLGDYKPFYQTNQLGM